MPIRKPSAERLALGQKRIVSILRKHGVASMRILEQKIADAGPLPQRIDPHIITTARNALAAAGDLRERRHRSSRWYYLAATPADVVDRRFAELTALHDRTSAPDFTMRAGQALEIAIFRALGEQEFLPFLGGFLDLNAHDDSSLYSKEEPPRILNGRLIPGQMRLDFLGMHPHAGSVGIEAKNIREWIYPDRKEVQDLLLKCYTQDAVPVLIARRIAYGTFSILRATGVLIHQTFNQLYPEADHDLSELVRDKNLLGYHDVRVGNTPDKRLRKFLHQDLSALLPDARARFKRYSDLLQRYGSGDIGYPEFAGRVRRRERGEPEDGPTPLWMEEIDEEDLPF